MQKEMLRCFRGHVLLGLPKSPLSVLRQLNRLGDKPHLFVGNYPFLLRLFPLAVVHVSAAKKHADILLLELSELAEKNAEKTLILLPCSSEARRFTDTHRKQLEPSYVIQTDLKTYGGIT